MNAAASRKRSAPLVRSPRFLLEHRSRDEFVWEVVRRDGADVQLIRKTEVGKLVGRRELQRFDEPVLEYEALPTPGAPVFRVARDEDGEFRLGPGGRPLCAIDGTPIITLDMNSH